MSYLGRPGAVAPLTSADIPDNSITSAKIVDGTIEASDVAADMATQAELDGVRNDIATLALHSAIADNKAAYNLSNAFIDQYEDDTGLDVQTSCDRTSSEFMATIYDVLASADTGGTLTGVGDANTYYSSVAANDTYGDGNDVGSASYNYSWWTTTALLTGLCMWEIHGGNSTQATNTGAGTANKWEWGVTSQVGGTGDGSPSGAQQNNNLTENQAAAHSATSPIIFASSGGTGQSVQLRSALASVSTTIITTLLDETIGWGSGESARFVRKDSTLYFQVDGVTYYTFPSSDFNFSGNMWGTLGNGVSAGNFVDVNYRSGMTTAKGVGETTENAAGNYTSATQTANASVSSMGIVVLYKDNAGTATLNSGGDLIASVSANGGTNYTDVTLVAGGTFSTGLNIAAVSGVSVTAGNTPKYKISFANQASGSKETQVYGVALLY